MRSQLLGVRMRKLLWLLLRPHAWGNARRGVVPSVEHIGLIRSISPSFVIDAGANRGQFSLAVRSASRTAEILAFEPLAAAGAALKRTFRNDGLFTMRAVALGAESARVRMQVTSSDDSSSLLPIGVQQTRLFPSSRVAGHEEVAVETLDSELEGRDLPGDTLLKIDVQGGEFALLQGARGSLRRIRHVYVEASFLPLYVGQHLAADIVNELSSQGFALVDVANVSRTAAGAAVQADFLFERSSEVAGE